MPIGALMSAAVCVAIATGDQIWHFILGFSCLVGGGGVLHSVLPSQTLLTNWFDRYRARVLAIFSTSIAVGGFAWLRLHNEIEQVADWRTGWWIAAGIQCAIAVMLPLFVRNQPEALGLHPDGAKMAVERKKPVTPIAKPKIDTQALWSAIATPQFALLVFVSVAAVAPNGLVLVHGRLHLESLGLSQDQAVGVLSISALIGILGRLASGAGDFIPPKTVLIVGFGIQAAGTAGLIFADTLWIAYASVAAMGVGFGAGFQTITVMMGRLFGRERFAATHGARTACAGVFNATIPWAVGLSADRTGSYTLALAAESAALVLLVLLCAFFLKPPEARDG